MEGFVQGLINQIRESRGKAAAAAAAVAVATKMDGRVGGMNLVMRRNVTRLVQVAGKKSVTRNASVQVRVR